MKLWFYICAVELLIIHLKMLPKRQLKTVFLFHFHLFHIFLFSKFFAKKFIFKFFNKNHFHEELLLLLPDDSKIDDGYQ